MRKKRKVPPGAKVVKHRDAQRNTKRLYVPAYGPKARPLLVRRQ